MAKLFANSGDPDQMPHSVYQLPFWGLKTKMGNYDYDSEVNSDIPLATSNLRMLTCLKSEESIQVTRSILWVNKFLH